MEFIKNAPCGNSKLMLCMTLDAFNDVGRGCLHVSTMSLCRLFRQHLKRVCLLLNVLHHPHPYPHPSLPLQRWDEITYPSPNLNGGIDKYFHPTLYRACNYLIHVSKRYRKLSTYMDTQTPRPSQIAKFMGPTWVLSAPAGPHVYPMNVAFRACLKTRGFWVCK